PSPTGHGAPRLHPSRARSRRPEAPVSATLRPGGPPDHQGSARDASRLFFHVYGQLPRPTRAVPLPGGRGAGAPCGGPPRCAERQRPAGRRARLRERAAVKGAGVRGVWGRRDGSSTAASRLGGRTVREQRSEEHTSELQSRGHLVCRLLLEKKKNEREVGSDLAQT